jgi:NADH:ubiquinone oxidoreductase subunit E
MTDVTQFDLIIDRYERSEESLLAILQDFQREYRYVPEEGIRRLSEVMEVPESKIYAMGTFYKGLSLTPRGRHTIKVCTGTACHLKGAPQILETLERELEVKRNGTTTDGEFTLECVNCVGACAMAPLTLIDEEYNGQTRSSKIMDIVKKRAGS